MADQIVITEKSSQAKDVRAAVGSRYGEILAAEGHLFDLLEPEDVVPSWKRWSPILLRPEGLYGTRPAEGGNKAAKLRAIREALRTAKRVWLATDCDREGQLIGQEILEHYEYRGQVMRVLFTAQDSQTIRDAFGRAKPNSEYARLYAAAVARRQADQIYNLSLTRTATVILGQGARKVIGVGRVKTPTLAIVCKRELEIRNFVPLAYFEVVATAKVAVGQFQMRHAPQERIVRREIAQEIADAAQDFEGALAVRVEDKRQGPPKLHDLPSLQKLCGSRFGWPASKTVEVAQELYDGQGKKIITYPRAEVRYLPQSLMSDVPKVVAGLRVGQSFSTIPVPNARWSSERPHRDTRRALSNDRQRMNVVAEAHSAMEIVEIALQSQHQRPALPIAADLSAGQRAIGIKSAASASGDHHRIGAQQVSARPHGRREVRSAGAGAEIEPNVTTGPLISRRLRFLRRNIGRNGSDRTAAEQHRCCDELCGQQRFASRQPDFDETIGHAVPLIENGSYALGSFVPARDGAMDFSMN